MSFHILRNPYGIRFAAISDVPVVAQPRLIEEGHERAVSEPNRTVDEDLWAQIISAIFGLWSTYLLTKGDGRGWALGAAMAVLSAYVFITRKIYGSFLIQILYLSIALTGLYK